MLGFAWSELVLIGAVALVVIGPKDLPKVMRTLGQWSRRLRVLSGDFQRHIDEMVRQAELDDIKRETEKAMDVGDIAGDMAKAAGAEDIERSFTLDESTAAANVPIPPEAVPPPSVTLEPEPAAAAAESVAADAAPAHPVEPQAPARETTP